MFVKNFFMLRHVGSEPVVERRNKLVIVSFAIIKVQTAQILVIFKHVDDLLFLHSALLSLSLLQELFRSERVWHHHRLWSWIWESIIRKPAIWLLSPKSSTRTETTYCGLILSNSRVLLLTEKSSSWICITE